MTPRATAPQEKLFRRLPSGPTCGSCPLGGCAAGYEAPFGSGFATPYGEMRSGVMLVTEALDSTEDVKQERALAGRGGFLLQRAAARRHWKLREEFRIVPSLFCKPSHGLWPRRPGASSRGPRTPCSRVRATWTPRSPGGSPR